MTKAATATVMGKIHRLTDYVGVKVEIRPNDNPPWGCLEVNGRHIWRFDTVEDANGAAANLIKALAGEKTG